MKKTIIVIAFNREQFRNWVQALSREDSNNYIFADAKSIMGARADAVIELSWAYDRKDYKELKALALSRVN